MIEKLITSLWNRLAAPRPSADSGPPLDLGFQVLDGEVQKTRAYLPNSKRCEHAAILGKTGRGKSYLLRHMAAQDVRARRGFVSFDLHGDTNPFLLRLISAEERRTRTDLMNRLVIIVPADSELSYIFIAL